MIYKQPSIYKSESAIGSWEEVNGEFKKINANAVKYGSYYNSYLSATFHEKGGFLIIGGSIEIISTFTPTYSSSDEYGGSSWPCLMTIDITNEDFDIGDGYYGILEQYMDIKSDVRIGYQNKHITICTRDGNTISSGWPVLLNVPIFKRPRQ